MKTELLYLIETLKLEKNESRLANIKVFQEYFQEFFKKYPARDFIKISEISFLDIICSLILIRNPYQAKECLCVCQQYQDIIFNFDYYSELLLLLNYVNNDSFRELVGDINSKNFLVKMNALNSFEKLCKREDFSWDKAQSFLQILHDYPNLILDVEPYLINISPDVWNNASDFYNSILAFKEVYHAIKIRKDDVDRAIKMMIQDRCSSALEVIEYIDYLYSTYCQVLKEVNKELKLIYQRNSELDELIKLLDVDGEIKGIDHLLSLCPTEHIKELVVNYIISVNQKSNEMLWEQYQDLKVNSDENFQRLFLQYGYDYALYDEVKRAIIKDKKYEQVETILKKLNSYQIVLHEEDLLDIDLEKLDSLLSLITSGLFSSSFVEKHISELLDSDTFLSVQQNIQMLSLYGINMAKYHNSLDILLNSSLERNIFVLKQYGLTIKKDTTNLNFLNETETDLAFKIDLVIEMGYYEQLNFSLNILNFSKEDLENKKILEQLNISSDTSLVFHSYSLFFQEEFIQPEYLSVLKKEHLNQEQITLPNYMERFRINDYLLLINHVFVSIPRFMRNLAKFSEINNEVILASILYQGHYTLEEIENLVEVFLPNQEPFLLVRR